MGEISSVYILCRNKKMSRKVTYVNILLNQELSVRPSCVL
jgi:hypothetical protein